jgi:hypothetical protein
MHPSGPLASGRYLLAAAAAVTAFLAVGCGAVPAPGSTGRTQPAGPDHSAAPARAVAPTDSRAGAISYGRALLASLHLPPGAHMISQPVISWPIYSQPVKPIDGLRPFTIPAILTDMIDIGVVYRVSPSMAGDYSYLLAHSPAGTTPSANGYSSHSGIVTTEFVCNVPATLPAGIYSADLETSFKPVHGGGSLVRADAVIAWYPPRSPADYIDPSKYSSVTVSGASGPGHSPPAKTYASAGMVAKLAALANALHAAPHAVTSCPAELVGSHGYQIVFHPAVGRVPPIVVSPTSCLGVEIAAGRRELPGLYPAGSIIAAVDRLLKQT